jgi:hypothetical protein
LKASEQKLNGKQEKAIVALLAHETLKDAAKQAGISEPTLWRYMQDESFQAAYKLARRQAYEQGIGRLQSLMGDAVAALEKNLTCGKPEVENRAAQIIIEHSTKGIEIMELIERVDALDKAMKEGAKPGWNTRGA